MKKNFLIALGLALTFFAGAFIGGTAGFNPIVSGSVLAAVSGAKYVVRIIALPNARLFTGLLSAIDITELAAKLGDYNRENREILVSEMLLDQDFSNGWTVYDDVDDELPLPNLSLTDLIQPGIDKSFNPIDNAIKVGARILKVRDIKVDLLIEPWKLQKQWVGFMKKNKQDPFELPFEKFIMAYISKKVQENLHLKAIYKGVYNAGGATPADTLDGILTKIAAEVADDKITEIVTGAITADNVIDKVELTYDGLGEAYKGIDTVMKVSPTIFDWYVRKYRELFGRNMDYVGMARNKVLIDGTSCAVMREPGMSGSQRLIATLEENFVYGVASTNGYNIDIQKFDRQLKVLIDFKAGVEFSQIVANALSVNDQE